MERLRRGGRVSKCSRGRFRVASVGEGSWLAPREALRRGVAARGRGCGAVPWRAGATARRGLVPPLRPRAGAASAPWAPGTRAEVPTRWARLRVGCSAGAAAAFWRVAVDRRRRPVASELERAVVGRSPRGAAWRGKPAASLAARFVVEPEVVPRRFVRAAGAPRPSPEGCRRWGWGVLLRPATPRRAGLLRCWGVLRGIVVTPFLARREPGRQSRDAAMAPEQRWVSGFWRAHGSARARGGPWRPRRGRDGVRSL